MKRSVILTESELKSLIRDIVSESVYTADGDYNPDKDSRYRRLLRIPINRLTADDIAYIFTIHNTKTSWGWYIDESFEDRLERNIELHGDDFEEAAAFFGSLSFPLKVYRALRDSESVESLSGKTQSLSWTTDINIYLDDRSQFKNCDRIVEAEITPDMIQNEWTVCNYVYYSSSGRGRGTVAKYYPESEITLKPRFKTAALQNLRYIDKRNLR